MDQSPEQYLKNLTADVEHIIKDQLVKSRKRMAEQIIGSLVGIRYNTWGDTEIVSQDLVDKIKARIDPELKERLFETIAQECNAALEKFVTSPNGELRREFKNRLRYFIKDEIESSLQKRSDAVIEVIDAEVGKILDERLKQEMLIWHVAKQLQDARPHQDDEDD